MKLSKIPTKYYERDWIILRWFQEGYNSKKIKFKLRYLKFYPTLREIIGIKTKFGTPYGLESHWRYWVENDMAES